MNAYIRFKHPFTCIVSGPTGSGKNQFLFKATSKPWRTLYRVKIRGGIIWCYSEVAAVPREKLSKLGSSIQYQECLPENFGNARGEPSLIILDDLLDQVYGWEVCDLFTKGSHHRNISVLLLTQIFFSPGNTLSGHFVKCQISGPIEKRKG